MYKYTKDIVVHIIDDDLSVRTGLARLMRSAGFNFRVYESAEIFLAEMPSAPYGCILLDITMPSMSGLELGALMKGRGACLPVIILSALDEDEIRHTARDIGVSFFLRKPVDDQALFDAIAWVTDGQDVSLTYR